MPPAAAPAAAIRRLGNDRACHLKGRGSMAVPRPVLRWWRKCWSTPPTGGRCVCVCVCVCVVESSIAQYVHGGHPQRKYDVLVRRRQLRSDDALRRGGIGEVGVTVDHIVARLLRHCCQLIELPAPSTVVLGGTAVLHVLPWCAARAPRSTIAGRAKCFDDSTTKQLAR